MTIMLIVDLIIISSSSLKPETYFKGSFVFKKLRKTGSVRFMLLCLTPLGRFALFALTLEKIVCCVSGKAMKGKSPQQVRTAINNLIGVLNVLSKTKKKI